MRKLILLCALAAMLLSVGCWDLRVIDELALVMGIGVDIAEMDPEMLQFTFVHPVFDPQANDIRATKTITAYTLQQAVINLQHQTDQQPVLGKVDVFVFSEEAARNGSMHAVLIQFDQMRDIHPIAWICISRGVEAKDVINLKVPQQARVSIFLADMFTDNMLNGRLPRSDLTTYWTRHHTIGISPVIPVIELTGSGEEKTGILLAGLAVIDSSGKIKGYLSDSETIMYMLLTNDIKRGQFSTRLSIGKEKNRPVTAFVQSTSVKVRTKIINDKPVISIEVDVLMNGLHVDLTDSVLSGDIFRELEKALAKDIQGNMRRVIRKCQQWEVDIFGYGQHMRIQNYQWFQDKDWDTEFGKSEIHLEVSVNVKRAGALINPAY